MTRETTNVTRVVEQGIKLRQATRREPLSPLRSHALVAGHSGLPCVTAVAPLSEAKRARSASSCRFHSSKRSFILIRRRSCCCQRRAKLNTSVAMYS